jgi:hypothetical protein
MIWLIPLIAAARLAFNLKVLTIDLSGKVGKGADFQPDTLEMGIKSRKIWLWPWSDQRLNLDWCKRCVHGESKLRSRVNKPLLLRGCQGKGGKLVMPRATLATRLPRRIHQDPLPTRPTPVASALQGPSSAATAVFCCG